MVDYCLDTNIIIDIFRGDIGLKSKLEKIKLNKDEVFITPITLCELYRGAFLHHDSSKKLEDIDVFVSFFEILEFDINSCKEFGKEYARLKKRGKTTNEFDLMIISIAKVNNLVLVTRDKKHFKNMGIKVEVW